jgi:hypothetical protein
MCMTHMACVYLAHLGPCTATILPILLGLEEYTGIIPLSWYQWFPSSSSPAAALPAMAGDQLPAGVPPPLPSPPPARLLSPFPLPLSYAFVAGTPLRAKAQQPSAAGTPPSDVA